MSNLLAAGMALASLGCLLMVMGWWDHPLVQEPEGRLIAAILFVGFSVKALGWRLVVELEGKR